jgi:hypothetical protein
MAARIDEAEAAVGLSPVLGSQATKRFSVPPAGYRYLKVRKPDGTLVTVQRPIGDESISPPLSPSTIPLPSSSGSPEFGSPALQQQEISPTQPGFPAGVDKRRSRLRDSMIKGLGGAVVGEMPAVEVGDWQPDDTVVDHEDDVSDDEFGHDNENDNADEEQLSAEQSVGHENEKYLEGMNKMSFNFANVASASLTRSNRHEKSSAWPCHNCA